MFKFLLILGASAALLAGTASATSFIATTDTIGASLMNTVEGTSDLTASIDDDKIVLDARDDAAQFVASNGQQRGAKLQAALEHIRREVPAISASDLELAQAIMVR